MATEQEPKIESVTDFGSDNAVVLLVGPDEQSMTVHKPFISRRSDFFAAALRKEWTEGRTRTIKLPEESPDTMQHYINHVYSAKLPTEVFTADNPGLQKKDAYECLAKLYVLGERLLDSSLRNAVVREILRLRSLKCGEGTNWNPTTAPANIIYNGTTAGSPARRLFIDLTLRYGHESWHTPDAHQTFLYDVTQALLTQIQAHGPAIDQWRRVTMMADDYYV